MEQASQLVHVKPSEIKDLALSHSGVNRNRDDSLYSFACKPASESAENVRPPLEHKMGTAPYKIRFPQLAFLVFS